MTFRILQIPSHQHQSMAFNRLSPAPLFSVRCRAATAGCHVSASLYEVLRVKHSATQADIKKAYRRLAKLYHPDVAAANANLSRASNQDSREFLRIHNAYETLSDPKSRADYDRSVWTTSYSFGNYSSSASTISPTRSWESDQCW